MTKDYYSTLELQKGASEDEIKKAFKRLSLIHHPDRNPPDKKEECDAKYKEITEAYSVLGDVDKKRVYDQTGGTQNQHNQGFSDIFSNLFGMNFNFGQHQRAHQNQEMFINVPLTLEDVYIGFKKTKKMKINKECKTCCGTGKEFYSTCTGCNGSGQKKVVQRIGPIITQMIQDCNECGRKGRVGFGDSICKQCTGSAKEEKIIDIEVSFPIGVEENSHYRHNDEGISFVFVAKIDKHPLFNRDGNNLKMMKDIPLIDALSGLSFNLKLLDNREIIVKSDNILKPNTEYLLKNLGISGGDIKINFNIIFPDKLEDEDKEKLNKIFKKEEQNLKEGEIYFINC